MAINYRQQVERAFEFHNEKLPTNGKMVVEPTRQYNEDYYLGEGGIYQHIQRFRTNNEKTNAVIRTVSQFVKHILTEKLYAINFTSKDIVNKELERNLETLIASTQSVLAENLNKITSHVLDEKVSRSKSTTIPVSSNQPPSSSEINDGDLPTKKETLVSKQRPRKKTTKKPSKPTQSAPLHKDVILTTQQHNRSRRKHFTPSPTPIPSTTPDTDIKIPSRKISPMKKGAGKNELTGFIENRELVEALKIIEKSSEKKVKREGIVALLDKMKKRLVYLRYYTPQEKISALHQSNDDRKAKSYIYKIEKSLEEEKLGHIFRNEILMDLKALAFRLGELEKIGPNTNKD